MVLFLVRRRIRVRWFDRARFPLQTMMEPIIWRALIHGRRAHHFPERWALKHP